MLGLPFLLASLLLIALCYWYGINGVKEFFQIPLFAAAPTLLIVNILSATLEHYSCRESPPGCAFIDHWSAIGLSIFGFACITKGIMHRRNHGIAFGLLLAILLHVGIFTSCKLAFTMINS